MGKSRVATLVRRANFNAMLAIDFVSLYRTLFIWCFFLDARNLASNTADVFHS